MGQPRSQWRWLCEAVLFWPRKESERSQRGNRLLPSLLEKALLSMVAGQLGFCENVALEYFRLPSAMCEAAVQNYFCRLGCGTRVV